MFKRKRYKYYITYYFQETNKTNGFGSVFITQGKKIKTQEDIKDIIDFIIQISNFENVLVLNYKHLKWVKKWKTKQHYLKMS